MRNSRWLRLLAYVTGSVNQELLLRNEYLATENRILRAKLPTRLRLGNPERATLAEIGKRLGRKALREVACIAKPDTILAWYRRLQTPTISRPSSSFSVLDLRRGARRKERLLEHFGADLLATVPASSPPRP